MLFDVNVILIAENVLKIVINHQLIHKQLKIDQIIV